MQIIDPQVDILCFITEDEATALLDVFSRLKDDIPPILEGLHTLLGDELTYRYYHKLDNDS